MTTIFKKLILVICMVMSFATLDAQRPKGHRWYGGNDGSIEKLNQEIKGDSWSQDWRISRDEAVSAYMFNLSQGFRMLGSTNEFGIPEFMHVLQNSTVQTLPPGTVFTNTLVNDAGKAVAFVDTVGADGEKFFVYVDEKTGSKIAWAKASCMQSGLAVVKGNNPVVPTLVTPTQTVYAQTPAPEVNVTTGVVYVAPPSVTVVDSGDTYITNNYFQETARTSEEPYYDQGYSQVVPPFNYGAGAGLYAQASIGWGIQQPFCNTWGNSMYYGPRTGGGYVIPSGGGGSNSSDQVTNIDLYLNINNVNNNSNTSTNNNNFEVPFYQDPHIYNPHPNPGGGPVEPPNGNPPTGGTGTGGGPIDSENKPVRGYATKGGGRQTNPVVVPTSTSTVPRSTQSSSGATSTSNVSTKGGVVTRGTTIAPNAIPVSNNQLGQEGNGPTRNVRNVQGAQTASPQTVVPIRNSEQQNPATLARNGNMNHSGASGFQKKDNMTRNNRQTVNSKRNTSHQSFTKPKEAPRTSHSRPTHSTSRQMTSRPANNMGGSRQMSAPRSSGASIGMRR